MRQEPRERKERSGPLRRPIRGITEREKVKKLEVGEDKATTKVERRKKCVLAGESIYSRLGRLGGPRGKPYISENLFLIFSAITTRTDQLSTDLHVILRALLVDPHASLADTFRSRLR